MQAQLPDVVIMAAAMVDRIHAKNKRGKPQTEQGNARNSTKSAVRALIEQVFGAQIYDMGGTSVRTIGLIRAKAKIGTKNLAYDPCPG